MGALREKIKHAFAVDPPGPAEPEPDQREPVDWFCREVARRGLTTPGLIALEMSRPLNWVAAQAMHVLSPAVWAIARKQGHEKYERLAAFLERRGSIDWIARRIEHFEREFERAAAGAGAAGEPGGPGPDAEEDHAQDRC